MSDLALVVLAEMRDNALRAIEYSESGGERWEENGLIADAVANRVRQVASWPSTRSRRTRRRNIDRFLGTNWRELATSTRTTTVTWISSGSAQPSMVSFESCYGSSASLTCPSSLTPEPLTGCWNYWPPAPFRRQQPLTVKVYECCRKGSAIDSTSPSPRRRSGGG
jgi:hypothetical protein